MSGLPRYAVIVSRFPKFTETFILQELRGLEARGLDFELYAITHETPEQLQPDAAALDARANYIERSSREVVVAQLHWLRRSPGKYLRAWFRALSLSRGSLETLVRAPVTMVLAAAMARRMQRQGVDRVHAHWATYPTLAAVVVKELTGIPYSFTGHAHDIFVGYSGLGPKVAGADLVLTCTDHGRKILVDSVDANTPGVADKVALVHHGVQLERFGLQPLRDRGSSRSLHIVCVASLDEYKGHRHLLDACRLLVDDGVDATIELIGDGPLREDLEAQTRKLRLADRVVVRGRQPIEVVREALERADVMALASIQLESGFMDGIPNVLVEALATGRPVVASSLPGIRELIVDGQTGLLAEPGDAASLAAALRRLVDEPELAPRLAADGRAKVEAEHDAQACLDEVFRHLSTLGS
jgi:glycosyltransferase involved in cell wall biosynthesis